MGKERQWLEMNGGLRSRVCKARQTLPCTNSLSVTFAHALVRGREASWLWLPVLSGSGVRQPKSHLSFPHESPGASVSYDL